MTEQDDDIDADIRAALTGVEAPEAIIEPVETVEEAPVEAEKAEKGPVRAPDGKFVAKVEEVAQDTPKPVETEAQGSIRPPASWTPQAKAKFASADPDIQQEVLKREKDMDRGLNEQARRLKAYEPLEEVIAPHRQKWQVAGVDEATAVKQLLAASDWLERDPQTAIAYLAKQYGVTAQPTGQPEQAQPTGTASPEIQALQQELASLKQQIGSREEAGMLSQIEAFKQDPANLYFDNVRDDMAALLNAGKAKDLAEAYEMACWMRPDIRPLLQQAQVAPAPTDVARKKVAGASVTGSPAEPRTNSNNPNATIEDDIRAAISELQGQA